MVAQVNSEMFSYGLKTPRPDVFDSDEVLLALETARELEVLGYFAEAARWLQRGAHEAEKQGNDERALVLAHVAADLANFNGHASLTAVAPSSAPSNERDTLTPPASSIPPMLAALISSMAPLSHRQVARPPRPAAAPSLPTLASSDAALPTMPPSDAALPTMPPSDASALTIAPPSSTPTTPPPVAFKTTLSRSDAKPLAERRIRMGAIRVAITGSIDGAKSFSVERLEAGQPSPAGTMEAMLVLTGEIDGSIEFETHLPVASGPTRNR